jgi:hypothetical protein
MPAVERKVDSIFNTPGLREVQIDAFKLICKPDDWKAPINAVVKRELSGFFFQVIVDITATVPELEDVDDRHVRLRSPGYRMGPAGP